MPSNPLGHAAARFSRYRIAQWGRLKVLAALTASLKRCPDTNRMTAAVLQTERDRGLLLARVRARRRPQVAKRRAPPGASLRASPSHTPRPRRLPTTPG